MELYQARYFLTLAQTLNFTRAAEACNVTQPALTRAIQRLEEEFGGPLLHRERNLTQLTELGRQLLPLIEQTYRAAEAAKAAAATYRRREAAPLRLGLAPSVGAGLVAPVLAALHQRLDGLALTLAQAEPDALVESLLENALDAALLVRPEKLHERLDRWPLGSERYVVLCPPDHPVAALEAVPIAALAGEPLLARAAEGCDFRAALLRLCGAAGIEPRIAHQAASDEQVHAMVAAGLGLALAGDRQPPPAGLAARPLAEPLARRQLLLVAVGGRPHGPALSSFLKLMRSRDWEAVPVEGGRTEAA
ncbi:MAG: LysR family transcriptional regulator [Dongiaceae bacterium]